MTNNTKRLGSCWRRVRSQERSQLRTSFERDGFVVVRQLIPTELLACLREQAYQDLVASTGSIEYEADVGYPGAPQSREVEGGQTPRRLLNAFGRNSLFQHVALDPNLRQYLRVFSNRRKLVFTPNHHNCIMTKHPGYSSSTYWHQDIRFWEFEKPELITVWMALSDETEENGALKVIPGSHRLTGTEFELGPKSFLNPTSRLNQDLLKNARQITLNAGDALFFHCRLFHGANENKSSQTKFSLVLTYHTDDNRPIEGTRSTTQPELPIE